jgi:hypothetical protein
MVGNEEGDGHWCRFLPTVRCASGCRGLGKAGTSFLECGYTALEGQSCADDGDAKDQAAAETAATPRFYVAIRSGKVSLESPPDPASGEVLSYRMVYGIAPISNYRTKVVYGES